MASPWVIGVVALALCLCALQVAGQTKAPIDPSTLDPTDFNSAVEGYASLLDSKPYSAVPSRSRDWECLYFLLLLFPQACQQTEDGLSNPFTCCGALRALVDADKGNCLCEDRVTVDVGTVSAVLGLADATACPLNFPIPQVALSDLPTALLETPPCEGAQRTQGTLDNLSFLGLTELPNSLDDLPTFKDLFEPAENGPFPTSVTLVNVTRPKPSIIINEFSTAMQFQAIIAYPADKDSEVPNPETGFADKPVVGKTRVKKLPIVAFSPGFQASPEEYLILMQHLASFGMIVISQKSTAGIPGTNLRAFSEAAVDDVAYGLRHLRLEGRNKDSFLFRRVNAFRAGAAGHSFGGVLALSVAPRAAEFKIKVKAVAATAPTCSAFADLCDFPGEAIPKTSKTDYLILAGNEDVTGPVGHAEYFLGLVKESGKSGELVIYNGNHCLAEADPKVWPDFLECGRGTVSPFGAIKFVHERMGKFLSMALTPTG